MRLKFVPINLFGVIERLHKAAYLFVYLIAAVSAFATLTQAQNGALDTAFKPAIGRDYYVRFAARQTDGKTIVAGGFNVFDGTLRSVLVRLNADGTLDSTFQPDVSSQLSECSLAADCSATIYRVVIQPDGRILIFGDFSRVNGVARKNFARLNADGSLDTSFDAGDATTDGLITTAALQPDGKILFGGYFTTFNSVTRNRIARINQDGSFDGTFEPGTGFNNAVSKIIVETSGRILVGGLFTSYNGFSRNRLARLNQDGSLDTTYAPLPGANDSVNDLVLQSDGKLLINGSFTSFNGAARRGIARLNQNGAIDNSFVPSSAVQGYNGIAIQPDGKVLVLGCSVPCQNFVFVRLNTDGSLDDTFNSGSYSGVSFPMIEFDSNGTIVISGQFTTDLNKSMFRISRYNADGSTQSTKDYFASFRSRITKVLIQPDNKILVAGNFSDINAVERSGIARLNADGLLDQTFNATLPGGYPREIALQSDGKILVGGDSVGGADKHIVRLNPNGSLDAGFNPPLINGPVSYVRAIAVQSDGDIYIGGSFVTVNNIERRGIARLNADGSLDTGFSSPSTQYSNDILIQPDGKIVYLSLGYGSAQVIRLNPNGTVDSTFSANNAGGATLARQPDGKILVGGDNLVYRLNTNGSPDSSFAAVNLTQLPRYYNDFGALSLLVEPSGKILVGGVFDTIGGVAQRNLGRLNPDGSIDASLTTDFSEGIGVYSLAKQTDGKIVAGGEFRKVNNQARSSLARIIGEPIVLTTRRTLFDFDGDGRADVSVFRPASGTWFVNRSTAGVVAQQWGAENDVIAPADFDGDGRADLTVFRPSNGFWYIYNLTTSTVTATQFGQTGDVPRPADFDGDGRADLAVFRSSTGIWYRLQSSNNQLLSTQFGQSGDVPQASDFDGDGRADLAVFRPANGTWYRSQSSNSQIVAVQFGQTNDVPATADYDGDGKSDIAVFRPASGYWYRINSSDNSFIQQQFGQLSDVPSAADFDGDGKTDIAVFRPTTGIWYQQLSANGFAAVQFGQANDRPSSAAFGQ